MDESTFFFIVGSWGTLLAILMGTSKDFSKRWRWIIAIHLSPVICYGILKMYFYFIKGIEFNLWKPQQYTWDNLNDFFHHGVFYWSIFINIFSLLFFIYLLPVIPKLFYRGLYDFYYKVYRTKKGKVKYRNAFEKGVRHREFWNPINPKEEKIYDKSREKEFEYDLHITNKNASIIIQVLFCIIIFLPLKLLSLILILLIFLFMTVHRPVYKAIIANEHK